MFDFPLPVMGLLQFVGYGLAMACGWLWKAHKAAKKEDEVLKDAVRALIRDRIIHKYEKCIEAGWCSIEYLTDVQALYQAYTKLGGNGIVPGLMARIKALPPEPPANA